MFCIHCGTKLPENAIFCSQCGAKVAMDVIIKSEPAEKTKFVQVLHTARSVEELIKRLSFELGAKYNDVISVNPKINNQHSVDFLKRTQYNANSECLLVMFNSTVLDYAPGGWLITDYKIYNDSYLKTEPINIVDLVSIELCDYYNALICRTESKTTELDFAKTNDIRIYIAELLEGLNGNKIIVNDAINKNHFVFDEDLQVIPLNQSSSSDIKNDFGTLNPNLLCPHCGKRGSVYTFDTKLKRGISGGKATAALLTGGLSLFATGLSRKEEALGAHCMHCNTDWYI